MMDAATTVARLVCDQKTARRIADYLGESLDADDTACAAFEDDDGQWQVAIHFRAAPDEAGLRALVQVAAGDAAAEALAIERVATKDWVKESLEGLKPVRAGRFLVHGAHDRTRVQANDIGIEIEAALAFGTGHHGTTRGCLLALDALARRRRFRRVLDVGTGSGVLAMAAAKACRCAVTASDNDPLAVRSARANAQHNRTMSLVSFVHAAGASTRAVTRSAPYDLIFANILMGPLVRMAVAVSRLAAPRGHVVLSGLLPAHANAVLAIYRAQGLTLERRIRLEGWVTLVLQRP